MNDLCFFVIGEPRAKQSFKVKSSKSGRVSGYIKPLTQSWMTDVGWMARAVYKGDPITDKLKVSLIFCLPSRRRIDPDNLSKAVLDGMQGIIFKDDSQVHDLRVFKIYQKDNPGVWVVIEPYDPGEVDAMLERFEHLNVDTMDEGGTR